MKVLPVEAPYQFGCHMIKLDDDRRLLCDVLFQRMFAPHRLADSFRLYGTEVDASGKVVVGLAHLAELASEHSE